MTDTQLLDAFVRRREQAAFAQIVDRYAGLVHAATLRQVSAAYADDASQAVFIILAQKAARVDGRALAGWLVNTARFVALASLRAETRRRHRERKAALMRPDSIEPTSDDQAAWESFAPMLDEALARLDEKDRSAVTLRYLQGKTVREVAAATSVSEAAAGKRATRALQTLRDYFARRGIKLSAEALGGALAVNGTVQVPTALAGKLAATGVGGAAVSTGTASLVKGTIPLMLSSKTYIVTAAVATLVIGGGAAIVATQMNLGDSDVETPTTLPASAMVIEAKVGVAPSTQLTATVDRTREVFTRYATPAGQSATFAGKIEGLTDPLSAEIGIISLRGSQWTSNGNFQWQSVADDGTFTISAATFPEARRTIAVRAPGQSVTFFRAEFEPGESAREIIVRMKPTKTIQIVATDSSGNPINSFKAEIFDAGAEGPDLTDDNGKPLRTQRLDAPMSRNGLIETVVPLEPLSLMLSGTGIAPFMQQIDPREKDQFAFKLLHATPISVTITDGGKPVVNERVMLNNPAVAFSYTARKTDAAGHLVLQNGIPGDYHIAVRERTVRTKVVEGVPCEVEIDLAKLPLPEQATTRPAATRTATPGGFLSRLITTAGPTTKP